MSENRYLVAARKYRPQRFNEIVAQQHVTETLQNAIRLDRLAHAYLFSGPRGVGKTTAARILAKAINCTTSLDERDFGEPCRQCESCKTFEESRSLSILEIDAASNNRVEDIRDLRETIQIPPQGSKKKVYIIDEVHMLSNAAFNALLKTLEEPPPHALFIFATTEPNKVLPTILSRCQRFDFRRIAVPEIIQHLQSICDEEHIQADEASLMLIAHKGDGALRDSLSAFDQAVSLCGTNLTYDALAKAFGVVGVDLFFDVTNHVRSGNSAALLLLVDQILSQGYDLQEFLVGLSNHLRNLLVAATMPDTSLIEAAESVKKRYGETGGHYNEADLLRLLMILADGEQKLKTSIQPRLQMELTLLKMASMAHAVDLRAALKKLDDLEQQISEHGGRVVIPGAAEEHDSAIQPPEVTNVIQQPDPLPAPSHELAPPPIAPYESVPPSATPQEPGSVSVDSQESDPGSEAKSETSTEKVLMESREQEAEVTKKTEVEEEPSSSSPLRIVRDQPTSVKKASPSPQQQYESLFGPPALKKVPKRQNGGESSSASTGDAPVDTLTVSVEEVEWINGSWDAYVQRIKGERIHVSALLQHTKPLDVRDETLVLSVPDDFHKRMLGSQSEYLLTILKEFVSLDVHRISFTIDLSQAEENAAQETVKEIDPYEYMQKKRKENPIIKAIFDDFGGEMVW